jgi:hypothetical protein
VPGANPPGQSNGNGAQVLPPDTLSQTPELDSLALLATGLLSFGGYTMKRWRGRRR